MGILAWISAHAAIVASIATAIADFLISIFTQKPNVVVAVLKPLVPTLPVVVKTTTNQTPKPCARKIG